MLRNSLPSNPPTLADNKLQAELNEMKSEINSISATISHHGHDGDNGHGDAGKAALKHDKEAALKHGKEAPPKHIKKEVDWEVHQSRWAAIQVMLVIATIAIVLVMVYFSEMTRNSLTKLLGDDEAWEVNEERPAPNIYRAIAVLRPDEIGYLRWSNFVFQATICIIMQLYIPILLLYQNLVTYEVRGLKDYTQFSVSWWFGMMLRTIGLFNLARLFVSQTTTEIMDEYQDDYIILNMRRVRNTDRKKTDALVQFVDDLTHPNPTRRIAAAIVLRRQHTPGVRTLTSSDPEKVASKDVLDALCARLAHDDDEDEDGNTIPKLVEQDPHAKCAICHTLGVLAGPADTQVLEVLTELLKFETNEEVIQHAQKAIENIQQHFGDPVDDVLTGFWRFWSQMWVTISLLVTIITATFLEVVVFIKVMVLTGSLEEVTLIIMAMFFVNDLDEKVLAGQPQMKKMYWVQCHQCLKQMRVPPAWVKHVAADGAVPVVHLLLYAGLALMVTVTWRNRYTGENIDW